MSRKIDIGKVVMKTIPSNSPSISLSSLLGTVQGGRAREGKGYVNYMKNAMVTAVISRLTG